MFFRISGFALILLLLVAACGDDTTIRRLPEVHITAGATSLTPIPALPQATATQTATPTPLPIFVPTLHPTPRRVTVMRLSEDIDPRFNRLLEEGQPVPPLALVDIDGNPYPLDQQDGKVIVLNFWTVGCGSCFFEFPLLQAARDSISEDQLLILAVNVSDLAEETRILAESLGATYPMLVDPQGRIFSNYFGGAVVPTTYFIAADGTVAQIIVGAMDADLLTSHLQALGLMIDLTDGV